MMERWFLLVMVHVRGRRRRIIARVVREVLGFLGRRAQGITFGLRLIRLGRGVGLAGWLPRVLLN